MSQADTIRTSFLVRGRPQYSAEFLSFLSREGWSFTGLRDSYTAWSFKPLAHPKRRECDRPFPDSRQL